MEREAQIENHPLVLAAQARLRIAEQQAALSPWPYAPDTPVRLLTPTGYTYEGRVLTCDDEWLTVAMADPPDWWTEQGVPMRFYPSTPPERIEDGGVVVMRTEYRASAPSPEAGE